jgi:hypothetical protein
MAQVGIGYRSVWSMVFEIGLHLLEPYLYTTTSSAVVAPGSATINVPTLGYPVNACYVGAQLIIDTGLSQEIITVSAFSPTATPPTITATFALPHASGIPLIGVTFPTQAASGDPFFTQTEILSYIARAQNQFLADVPLIFALNSQNVTVGQVLQPLVCDSIEIHRIASSSPNVALASLSRLNGVVTATSLSPHGLIPSEKFAVFQVPDPNFDGAFTVATVVDNLHWTYSQSGANESVSGGGYAGLWLRLLEVSQSELACQNPFWESVFTTSLKSWWEDRSGLYAFGLGGRPSSNFPLEILCSIRDSDVLQLTDFFLVPDPMLHYVKHKALEYAWSKDGEQRDSQRAAYCKSRYDRGVLIVRRWMGWAGGMGGRAEQQMAMAGASGGRR